MKRPLQIIERLSPHMMALRLAVTYGIFGSLWIVFSDSVLGDLGFPRQYERAVGTAKGLLFVFGTSVLLYTLSRSGLTRLTRAQSELHQKELGIRQAYVDVIDAATGGKLLVVTGEEMFSRLGRTISGSRDIEDPEQLREARRIVQAAAEEVLSQISAREAVNAVGEALSNVLKHAGSGSYEVLASDRTLQVKITDQGPGIDFKSLPKATLMPGFSTTQTLGMGYTIMLQIAERVLICTQPGSTTVLLEFVEQPKAPANPPRPIEAKR